MLCQQYVYPKRGFIMTRLTLTAAGLFSLCFTIAACSTKADGPAKANAQAVAKPAPSEGTKTAQKAKPKTATPAIAAKTPKAAAKPEFAEAPYKIRFVSKPANAGNASSTTIEITPLDGYKMNKDFPSSLKVDPSANAATPKVKFGMTDAQVTEERIGFTIDFTPKAAGGLAMTGTTDFSVCNERTCKLFRGEKLAWEVSVK